MKRSTALLIFCASTAPLIASGQDDAQELAKKLSNPVASLISVPLQLNYDRDIGPAEDGDKLVLNVQPVVPISISDTWNLISRTIVPLATQDDIFPGAGDQSGLGDITQSLFFSPKAPTANGVIWGAGPALLLPTASDDLLGAEQWAVGPTIVALKQQGPLTYGALANHLWSVAGDEDRADVNATFLQPFLSHSTSTGRTYTVNFESSYDWEADELSLPVNLTIGQLLKLGNQRVQITGGLRYWLDSPPAGPEGFGFRLVVTLLYPK